jgi:glycine oxidase
MNEEVIIIGGGVIGTACAYFLSRRGLEVHVLERNHLGAGASGAAAAIIEDISSSDTPEWLRILGLESYRLILELEDDFEQPLEIIRGGSLHVALNEQEASEIYLFSKEAQGMGHNCELLNGPEARRLEPLLGPKVQAALYNPACYHVNPFRLCEGYLHAALCRGARIDYGISVRSVQVRNDRIERVVTDQGDFDADWVVVATGAYTPQVLPSIGIKIPIFPARGQVIVTEACPQMTQRVLMFFNHLYIKQTASGNFYLGSHTEFAGFENRITLEKITTYAHVLAHAVPILARLKGLRFFAGFRPISVDDLPVIGPVPNCPRLIIASGHGRTGIHYSASTGKAVSELIVDGKTELPIDVFSVDRFEKQSEL